MAKTLKGTIWLILLLFIASCTKEVGLEDDNMGFTTTKARKYFESYISNITTRTSLNNAPGIAPGEFTPNWNDAKSSQGSYIESVNVPISCHFAYIMRFSNKGSGTDKLRTYNARVFQKLIVTHNSNSHEMECYIMNIIPSRNYYIKHRDSVVDNVLNCDFGDFTGIVFYSSLNGNFTLLVDIHEDGVITHSASIYDKSKDRKTIYDEMRLILNCDYAYKRFNSAKTRSEGDVSGGTIDDIIVEGGPDIEWPWPPYVLPKIPPPSGGISGDGILLPPRDDNNKCPKCHKNPCECRDERVVSISSSATAIELHRSYAVAISVSGENIPPITRVEFQMMRVNKGAYWIVVDETPNGRTGSDGTSKYTSFVREAIAPGFWKLRGVVNFEDGETVNSNEIQVEEMFPSIDKFMNIPSLQAHLRTNLWPLTLQHAEANQATHKVREYGCFIMMETNGSYTVGPTISGPEVALVADDVWGSVKFYYNDRFPDPREALSYEVGTMHTHYPLTWAVPESERPIGPSIPDDTTSLPGILYDYVFKVVSGHDKNDAMKIYTHGKYTRRKTPQ